MKLVHKPFVLVLSLMVLSACGNDKKDEKRDSSPKTPVAADTKSDNTPSCPVATTTQSANSEGLADMLGQVLKNPDLLNDVIKLFSNILGQNNDSNPLSALLKALQGADLTQVQTLLKNNPDLAKQVQTILTGLNSSSALALQSTLNCPD
jgi:hypothetical protein